MVAGRSRSRRRLGRWWLVVVLALFAVVAIEIWATLQTTHQARRILQETTNASRLVPEKAQQEIIALRIQNEATASSGTPWSARWRRSGPRSWR